MTGKRTPLHQWHKDHGAHIAAFGGYEMPLWYSAGAREEHLCVLTSCGIFDTSHMSILRLTGPDIYRLLQWVYSRDLERCITNNSMPLSYGKCTYGVFLNEAGGVVDDVILFQTGRDEYLAAVNSGMGHEAARHILNYIDTCDGSCNVLISDFTDKIGKIDLQGPYSAHILRDVLDDPDHVFEGMKYFTFKGSFWGDSEQNTHVILKNGTPLMLSRTGYTGEFGFEIFIDPEHLVSTWKLLMDAGKKYDILPCGLAARDSLRVGAVLPLTHQDNGNWRYMKNPWLIALPYDDDKKGFTKDFLGRSALEGAPPSSYTYPFVGFDVRKVSSSSPPAVVIDNSGKVTGIVLSCVTDVAIGWRDDMIYSIASPNKPENFATRGLSCGFIKVYKEMRKGERLYLRDRKREIEIIIVDDIRPDRTARYSITHMLQHYPQK